MPPRRPQLPQTLKVELENASHSEDISSSRTGRTRSYVRNRKEMRHQQRTEAKQKKADYMAGAAKAKRQAQTNDESRKRQKLSTNGVATSTAASAPSSSSRSSAPMVNGHTMHTRREDRSAPNAKGKSKESYDIRDFQPRNRAEEDEDAYIATLEARLGIGKKKQRQNRYEPEFENDGLLDLLRDTDELVERVKGNNFIAPTGDGQDSDLQDFAEENLREDSSAGEWGGIHGYDSDDTRPGDVVDEALLASTSSVQLYRPRQAQERNQDAATDGQDMRLRRNLKGLLNRISEQNMEGIIGEIEGLYRVHRRHDVTSTLTDAIIEGICAQSLLLDTYVIIQAGLIACLFKTMGVEIGAHFVQNVVETFLSHYKSINNANDQHTFEGTSQGKECINLMVLLSELYNLKVVSCLLIYDIVREILKDELNETDVELLLKLAKGSGSQLRSDDPSSLKDIVQLVHDNLSKRAALSSRTRFMMEVLDDLKQNKSKRQQSSINTTSERVAKFIAALSKKRHVVSHEPLRVTLKDLSEGDTKGKWWLVGAAWGGDPLVDRQEPHNPVVTTTEKSLDNSLLKLARKQGMNTDIRRSIFVLLMSSDDFIDACERLASLKLTDVQQREILRVLVHCCGNEKLYNPYYTLVGQQLCQQSHTHRVTLQYCLWDFLRSLGESSIGGSGSSFGDERQQEFDNASVSSRRIANVAKAYGWWIAKDSLTISVLKPLEFTSLHTKTRLFLRQLFAEIFLSVHGESRVHGTDISKLTETRDRQNLENVFIKASRNTSLVAGLLFFLSSWKDDAPEEPSFEEHIRWSLMVSNETLQRVVEASTG